MTYMTMMVGGSMHRAGGWKAAAWEGLEIGHGEWCMGKSFELWCANEARKV